MVDTRSAAALLASVLAWASIGVTAPVPAAEVSTAEVYTKETLDQYFRLEWSKSGRNLNGYVYNSSNRRASRMQLLVEGVDGSGKILAKTTTWVRDVPPNNRAFFEVSVPEASSYRVSVLTFDWIDDRDRLDRRKAW